MGTKKKMVRRTCVVCGKYRKRKFMTKNNKQWVCKTCLNPPRQEYTPLGNGTIDDLPQAENNPFEALLEDIDTSQSTPEELENYGKRVKEIGQMEEHTLLNDIDRTKLTSNENKYLTRLVNDQLERAKLFKKYIVIGQMEKYGIDSGKLIRLNNEAELKTYLEMKGYNEKMGSIELGDFKKAPPSIGIPSKICLVCNKPMSYRGGYYKCINCGGFTRQV